MAQRPPRGMTIAGSDSGAGAGVQADLKTFAALGLYGTSVVTAVTAQNTRGVTRVLESPPEVVAAQIDAVAGDIGADVVKTGMLANAAIIEVVAAKLEEHALETVVVDPVMIAKSGDRLLQEAALDALRDRLLPLATVVTPNAPEAGALTGRRVETLEEAHEAARAIHAMGPRAVIVTGGHLPGSTITNLLYDGEGFTEIALERMSGSATHGTGCTFASAVASGLAKGLHLAEAAMQASEYVADAIRFAFPVGTGNGPLNHFYRWWE